MTPKMAGVLQKFNLLKHNIEADMDELSVRVDRADAQRETVKVKSHQSLDTVSTSMNDIEEFLTALDGSNGGPNSSGQPSPRSSDVAKR
jgi:hypothetical protein